MAEQIRVKLERGLLRLRSNPTSLIGRATAINNLLLNSLWFAIVLWVGSDAELRSYEEEITCFLWSGQGRRKRHRVSEYILFLLRQMGGLGVLSLQHQRRALAGKLVLWAMKPGVHPLQMILRTYINQLSFKRWGLHDYSWALIPCNTLPAASLNIWLNICKSWNVIKKNIVSAAPSNNHELQRIPIWTPHVGHRIKTWLSCRTPVQQRLLQEGISSFRHVTSVDGHILEWDNRAVQELPNTWQRCYTKITSTLHPIQLPETPSNKTLKVFVAPMPLHEGCGIWEFEMRRAQRVQRWLPGELGLSARHAYRYSRGLLTHTFHSEPPNNVTLTQLVTSPNCRSDVARFPTCVLGSVFEAIGQSVQYSWQTGQDIFAADTKFLRIIQARVSSILHIGPHRWTEEFSWQPQHSDLRNPLWKDYRAAVENCFLWQRLYRITATNHWRFPLAGQAQRETWCSRCMAGALEDVTHCFWAYIESQEV